MYNESVQDESTSISVPDSNRQWFSVRFTYQLNKKLNVDFSITYLVEEDVSIDKSSYIGETEISNITSVTRSDAVLMAVQYSNTF